MSLCERHKTSSGGIDVRWVGTGGDGKQVGGREQVEKRETGEGVGERARPYIGPPICGVLGCGVFGDVLLVGDKKGEDNVVEALRGGGWAGTSALLQPVLIT